MINLATRGVLMKFVIAMMKHETNTFSPIPTPFEAFNRNGCIFRSIPAADSGGSRPPIPIDSGHRFRRKPATHSGAFRPPPVLKFHS
jgi:hypothetical protein